MNVSKKKWKLILIVLFSLVIISITVFFVGRSFGFFKYAKEGEVTNVISIKGIKTQILNPENDSLNLENSYPVSDSEGLSYTPFIFSMTNTSNASLNYSILVKNDEDKQANCVLDGNLICPELSTDYIKFSYKKNDGTYSEPRILSEFSDVVSNGVIKGNETITYSIILWISSDAGNEIMNNYFFGKLIIQGNKNETGYYQELKLNGADPVLSDSLVPVIIDNQGKVTKANLKEEWYSYSKQRWANAVILRNSDTFEEGQVIPESAIESYFVWIPKYSYQLWDLGNYSDFTSIEKKEHTIPIKFGLTNTSDANTGECTTPGVSGEKGNCNIGEYMTHPAFLAFNTNGFWVGKFDTGYDGATTIESSNVNGNDSTKIVIKPNTYIWRGNKVGNMFKASYDYLREDESHMMKNTEWGAVAYLHHSKYGSQKSVRVNNNRSYITGYAATIEPTRDYKNAASFEGNSSPSTDLGIDDEYTVNYLNSLSVVASTTGNYTGIYDMSGGAWDYVMGYTLNAKTLGGNSDIATQYSDFFTNSNWDKYYDKYFSEVNNDYSNRILGDATGEMGPFNAISDASVAKNKSSWYVDYSYFSQVDRPWFVRGGSFNYGTGAGIFAFHNNDGSSSTNLTFRIVLAPTK